MAHDYQGAKKIALKTIIILAVVTVVEVLVALTGKGYIIHGYHAPKVVMNTLMIGMSLYKAYHFDREEATKPYVQPTLFSHH